jgi:hypothetical protein
VRALRRIHLRRRLDQVQQELQHSGRQMEELQALLQEKVRLKRALMDPGMSEGSASSLAKVCFVPLAALERIWTRQRDAKGTNSNVSNALSVSVSSVGR